MWVQQCHKSPMTGNGKHTTFKNGDLGDGLLLFYQHCIFLSYSGGGILVPGGELKPQNFEGASYYMLHV